MTSNAPQNPLAEPSLLLTKSELAKHLRCSERQVDKLTADGKIPRPIVLGDSRRWPRSSVMAWLQRLTTIATIFTQTGESASDNRKA